MTAPTWFCLGGPIHGQYRPAGLEMLVPDRHAPAEYTSAFGRRVVVVPVPPVLYRPTLVAVPGWRIKLSCWVENRVARGRAAIMFAAVLPGSLQHVPREQSPVCRWCYGRPMDEHETCSRARCITMWHAVRSLDTLTWRGEP